MKNRVILLAEDNEDEVFLLNRAVQRSGLPMDMHVVSDGEQAMAYLKAEGKYSDRNQFPFPAFLLLDLCMPRMNGLEVLEAIRKDPHLSRLIVVVFTVSDHDEDISRASDLHVNSYLVKPSNLSELDDLVVTLDNYWLTKNNYAPCLLDCLASGSSNCNDLARWP